MIFVMRCHVEAWSLGCELVPSSLEGKKKEFLPGQCREVTLACSEGNLGDSFSREKNLAHRRQRWCRREGEKMRIS